MIRTLALGLLAFLLVSNVGFLIKNLIRRESTLAGMSLVASLGNVYCIYYVYNFEVNWFGLFPPE